GHVLVPLLADTAGALPTDVLEEFSVAPGPVTGRPPPNFQRAFTVFPVPFQGIHFCPPADVLQISPMLGDARGAPLHVRQPKLFPGARGMNVEECRARVGRGARTDRTLPDVYCHSRRNSR